MLICNYGLFWKVEDVFWGKQNNRGDLRGYNSKHSEVDFSAQTGIYVLYADYRIVYVGQTGAGNQRLLKRLNDHQWDHLSGRWNKFSWFGLRWVTNRHKLSADAAGANTKRQIALNHIEAVLIHAAEPSLNRQGGKWGRDVEHFYQVRDERLGPPVNEMIESIYSKDSKRK